MNYIIRFLILYVFVICFTNPIIAQPIQHNCDYLIITPDQFLQGSTWNSKLLSLQASRGLHPVIVSIANHTTIVSIQSIIADYYNNNILNLKYVLLIGNAIDNSVSEGSNYPPQPVKMVDYGTHVYIPFYAVNCHAFWSQDGTNVASDDPYLTGLVGHGQVYIGRIPVMLQSEITDYVNKLRYYYQNIISYNPGNEREILLNLDVTYPVDDCTGSLVTYLNNSLKSGHIPFTQPITELKVSEHTNGSDAFTYSLDRENLFIATLNSGASIMSILSTAWSRDTLGSWFNINSNFGSLQKLSTLPMLLGTSCNTGAVNDPNVTDNCMRKLLVCPNGGIIGAIAPTSGTEQRSNGFVINEFNDLIFQDQSLTYGEILKKLKDDLSTNYQRYEFFYKSLLLFGDPSMYPSIYKHRSNTITTNTTWSGNIVIDNELIVGYGANLTISPGTNVYFKDNASLMIAGTLTADASGGSPITFQPAGSSGLNNIIYFVNQSVPPTNSVLKNAVLNNIDGIKCEFGAYALIEGCTLSNSIHGIYIYNSAPSIINNIIDNPQQNGIYVEASGCYSLINGNSITRTTNPLNYQGIILSNNSLASVGQNYITGFYWGAYVGGGSMMFTNGDRDICNNEFTGNRYGIGTGWGAYTDLGEDDWTSNWNRIFNNIDYDIYTYQESSFSSFYDYFGTSPKLYTDKPEWTEYEYSLTTNPCRSIQNKSIQQNVLSTNTLNKSVKNNIQTGLQLEKEGKIDDAIDFYKNLIIKGQFVEPSLTRLSFIQNKYSRPEITAYFENLLSRHNNHYGKIKKHLGDIYLQRSQFDNAMTAYDDVISNSSTEDVAINARFDKLFAYMNIKNNTSIAAQILDELEKLNLTDQYHIIRLNMAKELIAGANKRFNKNSSSKSENIPISYELSQNYPNPFNPSTTIKYQIPKAGFVTLKVYDILGKEAATLVNENKDQGFYNVNFDASKLSSGIYIYQIKSNEYIVSKKMILLK